MSQWIRTHRGSLINAANVLCISKEESYNKEAWYIYAQFDREQSSLLASYDTEAQADQAMTLLLRDLTCDMPVIHPLHRVAEPDDI